MNRLLLTSTLLVACALAACDRPVVVNNPAPVVGVPGPMGPQGATGNQGNQGNDGTKGATGKTGDSTAIIVMPPASAPAN
jgi:hypothetical protein